MPRYDYRCVECGLNFELRQSFSEAGRGVCPQCAGVGQRVYHAVPVIYKGSGFYTTDYGRPKPPVEKEPAAKNGSDSGKSSSDSKPAESGTGSSNSDSSSSSSDSSTAAASAAST